MSQETVVLVHGLYLNGADMTLLKHRLEQSGFRTRRFSYPSLKSTPRESAMDLQTFAESLPDPVIHFVCHSLGGLVVRHLFDAYPEQRPGRIVTLGTPHNGSSAALRLLRYKGGRLLLGKSIQHGLKGDLPSWQGTHELGSIAGTLRLGLGMIIPGIPRPNDGTVAVSETRLEGMTDHIELPVSHFGMLLSQRVAVQTARFLQYGHFRH